MGVSGLISRLLSDGRPNVVVECRHCGLSVSPSTDRCPACGGREISRYEIAR